MPKTRTPIPPAALIELERAADTSLAAIVDLLALALALKRDDGLRSEFADGSAAFRLARGGGWLVVADDVCEARRTRPAHLPHRQVMQRLASDADLQRRCREAGRRTGAYDEASGLLAPLLSVDGAPKQADIARVLPWAPLVEKASLAAAVRISFLLRATRTALVERRSLGDPGVPDDISLYWSRVLVMASMMRIATTPGSEIQWQDGASALSIGLQS